MYPDRDSLFPPPAGAAERCCASVVDLPPAPAGSRRRRLWDLDGHAQCPVIGLCLPVATLRRLMLKLDGQAPLDDYELHCVAVAATKHRTRVAEAAQRELDRSHALALRSAAAIKTEAALQAWWEGERFGPQMAGALWALLTHARCTPELERLALGHVHMQQHELGRHLRAQADRMQQLQAENARLARDKAAVAARAEESAREHARQREALHSEAVRLRGVVLARETLVAQLREEAEALRRAEPDLPARKALAQQLQQQAERMRELQHALQRAHDVVERLRATPPGLAPDDAASELAAPVPAPGSCMPPPCLDARAVLCVGGRAGAVPVYRRLVEDAGGRFLHHDGEEDNPQRLDATLAAADLVICQAGCVSHGAYWRVKDHCKRTGKRCVFLDKPSSAGLRRALLALVPATA